MIRRIVKVACALAVALATMLATVLATALPASAHTLGVDTIESVLLYHVVPGATITYRQALKANGAVLQTALKGATIKVKVRCWVVILKDNDPNARNPIVVQPNLNKGNKQIGLGISRVLRPVDL